MEVITEADSLAEAFVQYQTLARQEKCAMCTSATDRLTRYSKHNLYFCALACLQRYHDEYILPKLRIDSAKEKQRPMVRCDFGGATA